MAFQPNKKMKHFGAGTQPSVEVKWGTLGENPADFEGRNSLNARSRSRDARNSEGMAFICKITEVKKLAGH